MIYLFLGEYKEASDKANGLANSLLAKQTQANLIKINTENFLLFNLSDLIASQGLFFSKNIFLFSKVLESPDIHKLILDKISDLAQSDNLFIFVEEDLDKKTFEKFEKKANKIQEIKSDKLKQKKEFNIFILAEALAKKNKKDLWLLYLENLKRATAEEIYGIFWWQIKTLLLIEKNSNAKDAGLKPFVYSKNEKFLANFKENEIEKIGAELIRIYHQSRRGGVALEIALEKWILKL
jgi:hypothetical protein